MSLCYNDLNDNSILLSLLKYAFQGYRGYNNIWNRIEFVLDEFRKDLRNLYINNISSYDAINELNRRLGKIILPFIVKFRIHVNIDNEIIQGFQLTNAIWYRPTNIASNDMFYFEILPTFTTIFQEYTYNQWLDFKNILKGLFAVVLFQKKIYNDTKVDLIPKKLYNKFNVAVPFGQLSYINSLLEIELIAKQTLETMKNSKLPYTQALAILDNEKKNMQKLITFTDNNLNTWVGKKQANWRAFIGFLKQNFNIYYETVSPTGGIFIYEV